MVTRCLLWVVFGFVSASVVCMQSIRFKSVLLTCLSFNQDAESLRVNRMAQKEPLVVENDPPPALFEGDILPDYQSITDVYGPAVVERLVDAGLLHERDKGLGDASRWESRIDDLVVVPYAFSESFDAAAIRLVNHALQDLAGRNRVVTFVPRTTEEDYILITGETQGCFSSIGKRPYKGAQTISLQNPNCLDFGTIQHEFLHALGFWHEQSRSDRDEYVTINFENILPYDRFNFEKVQTDSLGSDYDYGSIMHYGAKDFSSNGKDTISAPNSVGIGQNFGADEEDIRQVQLLYQCVSGPRNQTTAAATPCSADCKCWEGANGCGRASDACQGSLVCSNNECVKETERASCGWLDLLCFFFVKVELLKAIVLSIFTLRS